VDYANWDSGEPNNAGGIENFVQVLNTGRWNDNSDTANPVCGIVEVPGKSNEKSLTEQEKSLIGTWYNNGDPDQPCWVAGTDQLLFAVDQNKDASRVIYTRKAFSFPPSGNYMRKFLKTKFYGAGAIGGRENRLNIKPTKSLRTKMRRRFVPPTQYLMTCRNDLAGVNR
jgi:hypothetical protein